MYRRSRNEPPDRTGELIADRYRIERAIAQGGMGSVYLASQMNLQRQVAIKILPSKLGEDEGFRQRFMFEVATGARLQHPNIVSIYDYGETEGGELFMAMELVPGEPLSRAIEREGRLSPVRCCEIALQICSALNVAHKAGIVHRDLKPSNVMIGWSGEDELGDFVKVLDFGLAKRFGGEVPESEITDSGIWLGSVHYMSPEQIRCEDIDPRSDIYSLGVLMYHMLAARVPFAAPKVVDVLQKQLNEKPRPLQDLLPPEAYAPEVDVVMERCLEKNPDERYASVKDLATELKAALRMMVHVTDSAAFSALFTQSGQAPSTDTATMLSEVLRAVPPAPEARPFVGDVSKPESPSSTRLMGLAGLAMFIVGLIVGAAMLWPRPNRADIEAATAGPRRSLSETKTKAALEAPLPPTSAPAAPAPRAQTRPKAGPAGPRRPPPPKRKIARPAPKPVRPVAPRPKPRADDKVEPTPAATKVIIVDSLDEPDDTTPIPVMD